MEREEYVDYWTMKWCDLLRVKSEFPINLWPNAVQAYHRWIRTCVKENMPYDRFVREMLTASGSNFRKPQVNFLLSPAFFRWVGTAGEETTVELTGWNLPVDRNSTIDTRGNTSGIHVLSVLLPSELDSSFTKTSDPRERASDDQAVAQLGWRPDRPVRQGDTTSNAPCPLRSTRSRNLEIDRNARRTPVLSKACAGAARRATDNGSPPAETPMLQARALGRE